MEAFPCNGKVSLLLDLRDSTLCVGYDGSGGAFDAILRCSPNSSENGHIRHCRAQTLYEIAGVLLCQRRRGGNANLRRIVSARE